ncbi:uracil-DNA glycosylase [Candidatus Saccharibacteria bacterium]|nr:MAG: uracil-DNA glycosylase [Candidatus Saccharibacteria bacterium]
MSEQAAKKQRLLDDLQAKILSDGVCPDLAAQATQLVFGDGNPDSDIVFIGEAPGKNEDLQGRPFVGAAGKFLDEMLQCIHLQREHIYITNIVKYRPPNNRDPLPAEKQAFLPYLQVQLEIIQPKIVVTLGRHSTNCFLPDLQISKVHGQPKRIRLAYHGRNGAQSAKHSSGDSDSAGSAAVMPVVILPLYHPAAALYNGAMRQTLLDDFVKIPAIIEQL